MMVAGAVVLTGVSYAHFVARKTVSHSRPFDLGLGPGNNSSQNDRRTYDFCPPSSALGAGTVWFSWSVDSGSDVLLVVIGPAPVNATIYNSTVFVGYGSGSFTVTTYDDTNCGSYSFRMYVSYSSEMSVLGMWNYTTAVPFL